MSTSLILSVFRYAAPILIDSTKNQLDTLQTLLMKTTRPILGFISYKWSTITIMKKLNWPTIHQLVIAESLKLIHNIFFEGIPRSINSHFIYSDRCESLRMVRKLRMKDLASDDKLKQSVYYRTIFYTINYPIK